MQYVQVEKNRISASQLFCILILMRVTAELVYPTTAGFGGTGLASVLTAEVIRFLLALPVLIYSFRGREFYAAIWRKNRLCGWACAIGAALLLALFVVRTVVYSAQFIQRNMLMRTPALLLALLVAGFAAYAAVKGCEALARSGVLFLSAAALISLLVVIADIPYIDITRKLPEWNTPLFISDLYERLIRSGEYLVFAGLLPYVRTDGKNAAGTHSGAAGMWFAGASVVCSALICVFFSSVLGEFFGMAEYPAAAAASLSDIILFKRLDGLTCAVWSLCAAFRAGVMIFSAISIVWECVKCGQKRAQSGKESCA